MLHNGSPLEMNYLNSRYHSVILSEAAAHFGFSAAHFCTLIKKSTGRTFLQINKEIKLTQACRALRETSLSIADICELVEYANPEHFMRLFKSTYGMTPGQYRDQNK
ncbi:MAG: AraC family transcriptional regulator [Lachnospiraceae bacterium]|nr:AraC family transcriptional regulator [Lachnospiraceae bacterium]